MSTLSPHNQFIKFPYMGHSPPLREREWAVINHTAHLRRWMLHIFGFLGLGLSDAVAI